MAKRQKKKQKKANANAPVSIPQIEQRAARAVQQGDLGQARSLYRKLVKQDAEKYLPDMIAIQERLLNQFISNRKWNQVEKLLPEMRKLDPGNLLLSITQIQLALGKGDFDEAALRAGDQIARLEADPNPKLQEQAIILADALVLAFNPGHTYAELPPKIGNELNAVLAALEAVGNNDPAGALEHIKPIGLHSLFSLWKWYIKGICAYYGHEDQKALAALNKLPADSAPGKAAQAYHLLMGGSADGINSLRTEQAAHNITMVAGDKKLAAPMAQAQYFWRVGRCKDSFKQIKECFSEFPTDSPGLGRELTSFYYGAFKQMPSDKAENYLDYLVSQSEKKRRAHTYEKFKAAQAMVLWMEADEEWDEEELVEFWQEALSHFNALFPSNNLADTLVYIHLGELFSQETPNPTPFGFDGLDLGEEIGSIREPEMAESCFQSAIEHRPDFRKAHLALLRLYERTQDHTRINQTLDKIIKAFPDEKEALHKAGMRCASRNALIKGMKYLEQALALDPTDRTLREHFIAICIRAARSYTQKGNRTKFISTMEKAVSRASQNAASFSLGLAYVYAQWAVQLHLFKDGRQEAEEKLRQALAICHDPLQLHYYFWFTGNYHKAPKSALKPSRKSVDEALAGPPNPTLGTMMLQVLALVGNPSDKKQTWLRKEIRSVKAYLKKALGPDCRPEQARIIAEFAISPIGNDLALAGDYIRLMLDQNPDSARFRWLKLFCTVIKSRNPVTMIRQKEEMATIRQLAQRQGEDDIVRHTKSFLNQIESLEEAFDDFKNYFGDLDEDDFDGDGQLLGLEDDDADDDDLLPYLSDDSLDALLDDDEPLEEISPQTQLKLFDHLD